jgi:hypothetical protein
MSDIRPLSDKWKKNERGFWETADGYQIHYGKLVCETAPQFRLTACVVVAPDGSALCVEGTLTNAQLAASEDVEASKLAEKLGEPIEPFAIPIKTSDWSICPNCGQNVIVGELCGNCIATMPGASPQRHPPSRPPK